MAGYKLSNLDISFISLCKAGKNGKQPILKSKDSVEPVWKAERKIVTDKSEKRQCLYCIVCSPNEEFSDKDEVDGVAEVRKAMHGFMRKGRTGDGVDDTHNFISIDGAFVAESWEVRKNDPLFPDEKEGSWAVAIQIEDSELWGSVEKGEINGVSMGGTATKIAKASSFDATIGMQDLWKYTEALNSSIRSIFDDDDIEDKAVAISESVDQFKNTVLGNMVSKADGESLPWFKKIFKGKKSKEEDMDEKDVKALIKKSIEESTEKGKVKVEGAIAKALEEILEPIVTRLGKVEKSTKGSGQDEGGDIGDSEDANKQAEEAGNRIAKAVQKSMGKVTDNG